jgi:hypothetical protein
LKSLLILSITLLFCSVSYAQQWRFDFRSIDVDTIDEVKLNHTIDSLERATQIDSLRALSYHVYSMKHPDDSTYVAFVMGMEFGSLSIDKMNRELKANGFGTLPETFKGINFGMDMCTKRWLVSWLFNIKIKEKLQNDEARLSFASSAMATMSLGYDILYLKRVRLYPFLGLSYQKFSIDVRRKGIADGGDLSYYLDNMYASTFKKRSLAGQVGAELDVHLVQQDYFGIILAVRGGFQKTLIDGDFRMYHRNYDLDIGNVDREAFLSVGIKFFTR